MGIRKKLFVKRVVKYWNRWFKTGLCFPGGTLMGRKEMQAPFQSPHVAKDGVGGGAGPFKRQ